MPVGASTFCIFKAYFLRFGPFSTSLSLYIQINMRSIISFIVVMALASTFMVESTLAAPTTNTITIAKRDDSLLRGFGMGVDGVIVGVKSTVSGVANPQTHGSRQDTERAAAEAGRNVGGAIGSALVL